MPFLELFDETLDINATENYELSVQVSSFEVSFCILDTLRNKFVMLRSYEPGEELKYQTAQIEAIIKMDDFLTRKYKKRNIIVTSPRSTFIPAELFDSTKTERYFGFNLIKSEKEDIISNKLEDPDLYVVFSLPEDTVSILKRSFPGNDFMHHIKPLFFGIKNNSKPSGDYDIHIHIENEYFNLIIFDQNSLRFCNTFYYKTLTDIQYFILYVLKRLNIRMDESIVFSGRAQSKENIISGFSAYFSKMRFDFPSGNYTMSYVFNETELFKYINLFNAVSCE